MKTLEEGAVNTSSGQKLAERVYYAETRRENLRGLLGRDSLPAGEGLLLDPCRAIHTVGMRFPIDAVFLDGYGRVVRIAERIRPHRFMVGSLHAKRVLELPAGTIDSTGTKVGDSIRLEEQEDQAMGQAKHRVGNILLGLMFGSLATANLNHLLSVPTFGGAALFLINGLSAILFCTRRKAHRVTRRGTDWALTLSTLCIPWGLRAGGFAAEPIYSMGQFIQVAGLMFVLSALYCLGRSFGLTPAARGLVDRGPYRWLRHPMYTGELTFFFGFVLVNPTAWNGALLLTLFIGLPLRAIAEERLLHGDSGYQDYMKRVPHRFFPRSLVRGVE
jgi:protein-S-isoprenylcysteine O-methyltransferase Ste14/uncharacterized membrane protein (UPF0127 family)